MKQRTTLLTVLAVCLMTAFFSCKKETVKPQDEGAEYSLKMQVVSRAGEMEKAIVVGSKDDLQKAFDQGRGVLLTKESDRYNLFRPVLPGTTNPVDNYNICWSEIMAIYEAGLPGWQELANQNCKPVVVCLTCPQAGGGVFAMFVIKPTSKKCVEIKFEELLASFSFKKSDYNSVELGEYIYKR